MSRCMCCNEIFKPRLIQTETGKFLGFTDMCPKCVSAAYQEETYDEVFESVRVRETDGIHKLLTSYSTKYRE